LTVPKSAVSYTHMNLPSILKKRRNRRMAETIRARVKAGRLELLEKINLPEGTEVTVTIREDSPALDREAFRRSAGGWKDTVDAEMLIENIYTSRLISTRPVPKL
jgi:predicted DNA-binding antitoxin AbrB/MazE fold protein